MFNQELGKDAPLRRQSLKLAGALALVLASGTPFDAQAQTAVIYGRLGNFDVANLTGGRDEGQRVHGLDRRVRGHGRDLHADDVDEPQRRRERLDVIERRADPADAAAA